MLDLERHREMLRSCSIAAALESVGERWSFLILRGAFNGLQHFEEFQSTLGIARNILSNRLAALVEKGILRREPDPADRRALQVVLTDEGLDLLRRMWPVYARGIAEHFAAHMESPEPLRETFERMAGSARV